MNRGPCADSEAELDLALEKVRRLVEVAVQARRLLKRIEWQEYENGPFCPACNGAKERGHNPGCELAALLETEGA